MRIKPLVVLSLVCSLSQAADTVASLGDSIKATQFVTAVDHSSISDSGGRVYFRNGVPYVDVPVETTRLEPTSVYFYPVKHNQVHGWFPPWQSITVSVDYSVWTNYVSGSGVRGHLTNVSDIDGYLYLSNDTVYTSDPNADTAYVGEFVSVLPECAYNPDYISCQFFMRSYGGIVPFSIPEVFTNYTEVVTVSTNSYPISELPTTVSSFSNDAGYVSASTATNIAIQIIRNAVSGVNTNVQTAEDARVALTNLITILKNL